MKLSIIIVNWNVSALLKRCLLSIQIHGQNVEHQVFVVDNNSSDDSVEMVKSEFPNVKLIVNDQNRGFAAANNQAIEQANGDYVLLLNPDTELTKDSLEEMILAMERDQRIGVLGPQLLNNDGTVQPSVRRFPTFLSQVIILLKLHNFFLNLKSIRKYLAKDFNYQTSQEVDQVMGAAFLIRRELISQIGPLDEKFFIWFEEVDFCKRAKQAGWKVWFTPLAQVMHHESKSFQKLLSYSKQKMFNRSLKTYFKKHHTKLSWLLLSTLTPVSLLLSKIVDSFTLSSRGGVKSRRRILFLDSQKKIPPPSGRQNDSKINDSLGELFTGSIFRKTFLFIILLELLSFIGYVHPLANSILFIVIILATLVLSFIKLEYGLYIILAELFIGSKGYLFSLDIGTPISIRMGLFLVVMAVFASSLIRKSNRQNIFKAIKQPTLKWYIILGLFIVLGGLIALLNQNDPANIIFDLNAWFFFALLPVFFVAIKSKQQVYNTIRVLMAASLASVIKVMALLFIFTHDQFVVVRTVYRWVRTTGVGEITEMSPLFYRIFFQSQLFAIVALFIIIGFFVFALNQKLRKLLLNNKKELLIAALFLTTILISFSRSFWLGVIFGFIFVFSYVLFKLKNKLSAVGKSSALLALMLIIGITITSGIIYFPYPDKFKDGASLRELLGERATNVISEAGAVSRWALLPVLTEAIKANPVLGSGFGSTVTYKTSDPRICQSTTDCSYTTFAFEWGYLDMWVKIGLGGVLVYLLLLLAVFKKGWRSFNRNVGTDRAIIFGLLVGLVAVVITNGVSPYLNHPLGIGLLLLTDAIFQVYRSK